MVMTPFQRKWLLRFSVLPFVVILGIFMDAPRLFGGWGHYLLDCAAGSAGGAAVLLAWDFLRSIWTKASKWQRAVAVGVAVTAQFMLCFARNYGKPDASIYDILDICGIALVLLLWGCFQVFSRVVDRLWARISR
jgi:hypothetical protein